MTLLRCIRCGTARQSPPLVLAGIPIQCPICGQKLLIMAALDSLGSHGLMRMGDDDDGGGGGGGGSTNDDADDDSDKSGDDDDDEDDEDDGKGGKKKKKAKAQGGFFSNCLSSILFYLIGAALLLGCCGCIILGNFLGFFKTAPATTPASTAFVGAWEKKDVANKIEFKLTVLAANTGTFVDKKGDQHSFKWKTIDNNTVEFEMDTPAKSKFWNEESKSRFTHAVSGNDLTLTQTGGQAMHFTKASSDTAGDKKDDAASKDADKKKKTSK